MNNVRRGGNVLSGHALFYEPVSEENWLQDVGVHLGVGRVFNLTDSVQGAVVRAFHVLGKWINKIRSW